VEKTYLDRRKMGVGSRRADRLPAFFNFGYVKFGPYTPKGTTGVREEEHRKQDATIG